MYEDDTDLNDFSGVARLFPLPNLVFFPLVDQGLHIFEPRYRQMTADALASDRRIAIALLKTDRDWVPDYDGRPPVEAVVCLGKIAASEELPDGRFNLKLRGIARARIVEELPDNGKPYRSARIELLHEIVPQDLAKLSELRRELRGVTLERFAPNSQAQMQLGQLFESDTPLGAVCDLLGYSLPMGLEIKQALLAEVRVEKRVEILTATLRMPKRPDRRFPPTFSSN